MVASKSTFCNVSFYEVPWRHWPEIYMGWICSDKQLLESHAPDLPECMPREWKRVGRATCPSGVKYIASRSEPCRPCPFILQFIISIGPKVSHLPCHPGHPLYFLCHLHDFLPRHPLSLFYPCFLVLSITKSQRLQIEIVFIRLCHTEGCRVVAALLGLLEYALSTDAG